MTFYVVLGIIVAGMGIATAWVFYLERLEDRERQRRR